MHAMSFDEALQHVVVTAVTQMRPEDQRLRCALRIVINYQQLGQSPPLITNEHLDALERWMADRRQNDDAFALAPPAPTWGATMKRKLAGI
jgi:hypothetical protein